MSVVERLNARGEGIVRRNGGTVAVPLALPGDRVSFDPDGKASIAPLSQMRVAPPCPLHETCGGCGLQHLAPAAYAHFKRALVADALAAAGVSAPDVALHAEPLASRRRVTLTAVRDGRTVRVGYHRRASHDVVDVPACPAIAPLLQEALSDVRSLAAALCRERERLRLTVTLCDNGLDVSLASQRAARPRSARRGHGPLAASEAVHNAPPSIVRVCLDGEVLLQREAPLLSLGPAVVQLPPGAFTQASAGAERTMQRMVRAGVQGATRVADCFAGVGTFTLPLARRASVTAVESDAHALLALNEAARVPGLKPVQTLRRDLFRDPLSAGELAAFDAVVFDPPRAGAAALCEQLAKSTVARVVAVSCEPQTFARDCAILCAAGFKITQLAAVDQFVATPHIEAVAVLRRG